MLVGLAFIGCTSEEVPQQGDCNQETAKEVVLTVINNPQQIGANELAEYAGKVLSNSGAKSRAQSASTVTEVYSDKNGSGIYAVNFGENDGFVLLTTQQQMHPVIAMSETGHFDVASLEGSPIELWLKGVEMAISHPEDIPDSVVMAAKLEWNKLNSTEVSYPVQSRSDDDDEAIINEAISQWYMQGYSVTRVAYANANNYPANIANAITQIQKGSPAGSKEAERSFILTKETSNAKRYFPAIKTVWEQGYPYNTALPDNEYYSKFVGCVPLAVAQIMNYHKKPTYIDFSQFPDKAFSEDVALFNFLREVGNACGIDYSTNKSEAYDYNAVAAFAKYGYSCNQVDYNQSRIQTSLQNNRPVYMSGDVEGKDYGHAWVCDGVVGGTNTTSYIVKKYNGDFGSINPAMAFTNVASENVYSTVPVSYHMVWGWNVSDGWYYGADWTIDCDYDIVRIYKDLKTLVDIRPQ